MTTATFTLTDEQAAELVAALDGYGQPARIELPNNLIARLSVEPDYSTEINDFDCYGKVFPAHYRTWNGRVSQRPEGCDGAAEIVHYDRGSVAWWQPPTEDRDDRRRWHTDDQYRRTLRSHVSDLLAHGFDMIRLELCRGIDAYKRDVVIDFATLGGIEPFTKRDDLVRLVAELASDIEVPA